MNESQWLSYIFSVLTSFLYINIHAVPNNSRQTLFCRLSKIRVQLHNFHLIWRLLSSQQLDQNKLLGNLLVNKSPTKIPRECTVTGHITSYLRGTSYLITDSDGWDEEVNEDEMRDMLDKPVQQS